MAGVYRIPPVAQWYQPRSLLDVRSVDSPLPQPQTEILWLRRRPDFEADQQPRRLLDVSVTQSVDAPIPKPVPPIVNLRLRHPYEAAEQPRRLVDVAVMQSVDSPPGFPPAQLYERSVWFAGQQARNLDVSIVAPVIVADNPTGNITQALIYRFYPRQPWQQRGPLDVSVTQSVDVPPGIIRQQPWLTPSARGAQWDQLVPGNFDIAVTVPFIPQAFYRTPPVNRQPWQQRGPLDVSVTQSVDSPPGYFRQQPPTRPQGRDAQWDQLVPGTFDIAVTVPFTVQAYNRGPVTGRQAWQQRGPLDVSITQSVDSPPLRGLYPMAPYRRPVPPTLQLSPTVAALLAPTFTPPSLAPPLIFYRPTVAVYGRPGIVKLWRQAPSETSRPAPDRRNRPPAP